MTAPPAITFTCPACGSPALTPERRTEAAGFSCSACGAHVTRRQGHLHEVWSHRGGRRRRARARRSPGASGS